MIQKLEVSAQHTELTPELKKYVTKKIGQLDRYIPRHARESVHAEVKLIESSTKNNKQFTCKVTMYIPSGVLEASDTTINMFAAIDIVETKLKQQLRKFKEQRSDAKMYRKVLNRFRRSHSTVE